MNNTTLTILRTAASVVATGLTAAAIYYPDQHWIPAILLAVSVIGIHAIPSVGQVTSTPPTIPPLASRYYTSPTYMGGPVTSESPIPHSAEPFTGD